MVAVLDFISLITLALTHPPQLLLAPCVHHEASQFSTVSLNICHSEKSK